MKVLFHQLMISNKLTDFHLQDYQDLLDYIDSYWEKITRIQRVDDHKSEAVALPKPFLVPNTQRFNYQFYWDSFFMIQGILGTKREHLGIDIVENFSYLFIQFGIIPNISSLLFLSRSQPPLFSSMILDGFSINQDKAWLKKHIKVAQGEYRKVWTSKEDISEKIGTYHHFVSGTILARYGDRDAGYPLTSECESGWDFTSRFYSRCNDFLPVDLNCFLYKYELDFAQAAAILGESREEKYWLNQAKKRKAEINKYFWNEEKGFFFDYDYTNQVQSDFYSLAGFVPMWVGLVTPEQTDKMVKNLARFETEYGLAITDKDSLAPEIDLSIFPEAFKITIGNMLSPKQWDYPYIWRPVEYLTVLGLIKYGYSKKAKEIMEKAVRAEAKVFRKYGELYEKTNGLTGGRADNFHYPNQPGFGWTNAIIFRYLQMLNSMID